MTIIFRFKIEFAIILVGLLNFPITMIPALGEESQKIDGIEFSLPPEFKDKSPNHDLLLFSNMITTQNDTNTIPRATSRQQLEWLDRVMKRKWVDPRIRDEYVSYLSSFAREDNKTNIISSPLIRHYGETAVLYNYQIEAYQFTIVDVGERLSFLIRVSGNPNPIGSPLDQASNIFNVSQEFMNILRSNLVQNAGASFVMIDEKKCGNVIPICPNIYSRSVYGLFSAKAVFLSFDGLKLRGSGRSGTRSVWKDSCGNVRFVEQKSVVKSVTSQQSTNEAPGLGR